MPVQKKGDNEQKKAVEQHKVEEPVVQPKPIVYKKQTPEQERDFKKIDELTTKIGEIFTFLASSKPDDYQSELDDLDHLKFRLGMFGVYITQGELNNDINKISKLRNDDRVQKALKSLDEVIRPKDNRINMDNVIKQLKSLSDALISHIQLDVEEPTSSKNSPKSGKQKT